MDREGVRRVVAVLCEFLKAHLDGVEEILRIGSMSAGGAEQNGVFYAVLQTVFLIFCFRWRDLLKDEQDEDEELRGSGKSAKKWMPEMGVIQRAVTSVLNPLKVRLPTSCFNSRIDLPPILTDLRTECCDAVRTDCTRNGFCLLLHSFGIQ